MDRLHQLIVAVWQDVSRHLEIGESTGTTAALVSKQLPLQSLIVRRVDPEHRRVRTVAAWPTFATDIGARAVELPLAELRRLQRWLRQGTPIHAAAVAKKDQSVFSLIHATPISGDWFLAPLLGEHGSQGVLLAICQDTKQFSRHQLALLAALQEPMSAALDNDARLHELTALREAAEADRESLLRRLGRSDSAEVIVGDDSGLAQVMERVGLVSGSDVPVLVLGETGTGKELVARAIHNRSNRHSGPFLRVNCGAIPRELIDSQLFGHERGAFTGASESREGWFERANMGTLFLDEIGELPLDAQVRFLRVLQDGFVERVGSTKSNQVDVRVVAATHRDLAAMVREGSFREDLWYRIAVFPILLPPLRERLEDIPALARHFARRAALRFGLAPVEPSDADIELLRNYDWPGNIRELGAVIDRAAILGNGAALELTAALGLAIRHVSQRKTVDHNSLALVRPTNTKHILPLDDAIRSHIESALRATRGRVEGPQGAAQLLRINPHTLRARMRKLAIDWSAYRDDSERS